MDSALATLTERGFIQQCTNLPALDALLSRGPVTFYCGFDPTGPSLQAGHLIPLFAMAHLYRSGHRPIALIGGGTALIGDPTGRTEIRKIQTSDEIAAHAEAFRIQISKFIDFSDRSTMLNNADWLTELNWDDWNEFLRLHPLAPIGSGKRPKSATKVAESWAKQQEAVAAAASPPK